MSKKLKELEQWVSRPILPQNFRRGQWVVITDDKKLHYLASRSMDGEWVINDYVTGLPVKVLAVALPFVVVEVRGEPDSLDARRFTFRECPEKYVSAIFSKGFRKAEPSELCPTCDVELINRCSHKYGQHRWCSECGGVWLRESPEG